MPIRDVSPTDVGPRRAEVFAWVLYDWANSAYSTILITILYQYLTTQVFDAKDWWGSTLYAWCIGTSMMTAAVLSPPLGAMADVNRSKRRWLTLLVGGGAGGSMLLGLLPTDWVFAILLLFTLVSLCFELSLGIYNAFLPEITTEQTVNRVSAWGFGAGYLGGGLALILALLIEVLGKQWGWGDEAFRLRMGIFLMGLWWGGFSLPTLLILRDRGQTGSRQRFFQAAQSAMQDIAHTLQNIRHYRMLAFFLVGFLFYNEGVQTVLNQASTFATKELQFTTGELVGVILMIQFLALPGSLLVGWLADRFGQKSTLMGCLAIWVGLLGSAWFVHTKWQFWVLGALAAMVMGGTQSVSRAVMGLLTPERHTGQFFGFFNFSGKATSFMGSFVFGGILRLTGSARPAILSLLVFFLIGWAITALVNVQEGRRQALLENHNRS
ncbi:MAG: MFS transporter [Thermoguttaceae bacterium]|nr:MFS transporter [Thermoguttaceae bacterium]MDW8037563.1 MFS transporter [Thermoguttaceae bacterium]